LDTNVPKLILYVVPACPLCSDARAFLREHNIDFEERDVANDYGALRRMYKLTKQGLVPVFEYGGEALVRPGDEELAKLLSVLNVLGGRVPEEG
jgi:glutaredoxin